MTAAAKEKKPEPAVDLLGFGDDPIGSAATEKALPSVVPATLDGDDFDDFQSAPVGGASPTPASKPNVFDLLGGASPSLPVAQAPPRAAAAPMMPAIQPQATRPAAPPAFGGQSMGQPMISPTQHVISPTVPSGSVPLKPAGAPVLGHAAKPSSNFDDLWSLSLGASPAAQPGSGVATGKTMKDLAQEKAQANIWGGAATANGGARAFASNGGTGLFGASSASSAAPSDSDDLLL